MIKIPSKGVPLKLNSITGVSLKCHACLSMDRVLYLLNDTATVNTVCPELMCKKGLKSSPAFVCFECCAMIKKIFRFRKQVIHAQEHAQSPKQNVSLSRLSITSTESLSIESSMTDKVMDNFAMETPRTLVAETVPLNTVVKQEMDVDDYDHIIPLTTIGQVPIEIEIPPYNIKKEQNLTQIPFAPTTSTSIINYINKPPKKSVTIPGKHQNEKFTVYDSHKELTPNSEGKIIPKIMIKEPTVNIEPKIYVSKRPPNVRVYKTIPIIDKKTKTNSIPFKNIISPIPSNIKPECHVSSMFKIRPFLNEFDDDMKDVIWVNLNEVEMVNFRKFRSERAHFKTAKFKCELCILMFNGVKTLNAHKELHSEKAGPFQCKICTLRFADEESMNNHYNGHYWIYQCLKCSERFATETAIVTHVKKIHAVGVFDCNKCDEEFKTFRELKTHKVLTHSKKETCPECNKVLSNKPKLRAHMLTHSSEHEQCPICKKVLKKSRIKNHIANHKKDHENYYCAECDFTYQNEMSYKWHLKTSLKHNTIESFGLKCEPCNKYFAVKCSLEYHNQVLHNVPKSTFTCNYCNKDYVSKKKLRSHIRHMHFPAQKQFTCEICEKSFKVKKSLKSHIDSHFGRRPYKCEDCGDTFTHAAARYLHRRFVHKVKKKSEIREKELKRLQMAVVGNTETGKNSSQNEEQN